MKVAAKGHHANVEHRGGIFGIRCRPKVSVAGELDLGDQAKVLCVGDGFDAIACAELVENVTDVLLDRLQRHHQSWAIPRFPLPAAIKDRTSRIEVRRG